MLGEISDSITACLDIFNEFIEDIRLSQLGAEELVLGAWEDELGRLRIWAADIGAHQTSQSSLDFRLRDASHIRVQIAKLLQRLLRKLVDARDVLIENKGGTPVASPVQMDDVVGGDDEDDSDNDEVDNEDSGPGRSETGQRRNDKVGTDLIERRSNDAFADSNLLLAAQARQTSSLPDSEHSGGADTIELTDDLVDQDEPETEIQELKESLATTINCLFQMSILVRKPAAHDVYIGSKHADVAAFASLDYRYVKKKYPGADDAIVTRLGNAITRRRKYLTLRKRRALQLRKGTGNAYLGERDFADSQQRQIILDDDAWDKDISLFSTTSILPTGNKLAVPPPPESSSAGAPIECPYCFYPITVHGSRSWAEHVFQDLQPYICIAPTCSSADKLYPTRHEWLHHSNMFHTVGTIAQSTSETNTGFVACPLCKEKLGSGKQCDRHVAHHLEDLALTILPNSERRSDVEEYQDSDSKSSAESLDITISDDRLKQLQSLPGSPVEQPTTVKNLVSSYSKQAQDNVKEKGRKLTPIETLRAQRQQRREALISMANLALLCLGTRSRSEEVMELREQVMADEKDLLGSAYSDTLTKMANLASLCLENGLKPRDWRTEDGLPSGSRQEEEMELRRQVLAARKEVFGLHHPHTLASIIDLALSYQANGYIEEAVTEKAALMGTEQIMESDHPSTLTTLHGLGTIHERQDALVEATIMYLRILTGKKEAGTRIGYH